MDFGQDMFLQEYQICSFIRVQLDTVVASKIPVLAPTIVCLVTQTVFLACSANAAEKVQYLFYTLLYAALSC